MSKWIAEFDLEDGDTMPEHMDLNYMGAKIDFHCRPMWIPCSERLPEIHSEPYYNSFDGILYESDFVLVCYKSGKEKEIGIGQIIHDKECGSYEWYGVYDHADCEVEDMHIIAWMPLPEPYKLESEDKE